MKIYVYLKSEGTNVWRPVEPKLEGSYYCIVETKQEESEDWEFKSGDLVKCVEREFQGGSKGLVAVERMRAVTGMLNLSDKWARILVSEPETGMGYQIVTVILKDGRRFEQAVHTGGSITRFRGYTSIPF